MQKLQEFNFQTDDEEELKKIQAFLSSRIEDTEKTQTDLAKLLDVLKAAK